MLTELPATGGGSGQLISVATADPLSTHMQSLFIPCLHMASFQKYIKYFICMANPKMIQHLKQNISRTKLLIHPPQYVLLTVFPMSLNSNCIIPVAWVKKHIFFFSSFFRSPMELFLNPLYFCTPYSVYTQIVLLYFQI